jgi:hypothetical protein
LLFTKKMENGSTQRPSQPTEQEKVPSSARLYLHITELPLNRFISALVDGNLQVLVIEGNPSQEELAQAWKDIEEEYLDAVGLSEVRMERELYVEIQRLEANLFLARIAIEQLQRSYHPEFARHLNILLRTNFTFDPNEPVKYFALLKNCYNRTGGMKIDLDLKLIQYQAIKEKRESEGGEAYSRAYFHTVLITLSDFAGYQLPDTMTVFEYCDRIRRLNEYNEQIKLKKLTGQ